MVQIAKDNILTKAEFDQVIDELENATIDSGQATSAIDLTQVSKAMAVYAGGGSFYTDSGAANAYVLSVIGTKKSPPAYFVGMRIGFIPGNSNTGSSTINVATIGAVNLNRKGGANALAEDIRAGAIVEAVYNGTYFELVERHPDKLTHATDTGAADAYAVSLLEPPSAYYTGMVVSFTPANTNTGASTINVNALGAKAIQYMDGTALSAGAIVSSNVHNLYYDGTQFKLANPSTASTGPLGATTLTLSGAAPATPTANVLYKDNIPKAWVNFNGTGTVAIRSDFNVSSITDNGVGDYTINFATNMANANYSTVFGFSNSNNATMQIKSASAGAAPDLMTTSQLRVTLNSTAGANLDGNVLCVHVFGEQ